MIRLCISCPLAVRNRVDALRPPQQHCNHQSNTGKHRSFGQQESYVVGHQAHQHGPNQRTSGRTQTANDDDDKDGVKNAIDKCPRTPLGQKVDAQGCALGDEVFISLSVLFATNKATIVDNAFVDILKVAAFMRDYPDVVVTIEGHTDDRASIDHNQKLSQRRAEAVRKELIRFGADAQKMIAIGYGELKPIASNDTETGRAQNRRVIATAKINKQVKE